MLAIVKAGFCLVTVIAGFGWVQVAAGDSL